MEVKYLIELLREYARSENDAPLYPDEAVNIIILLQQYEKYKKILQLVEEEKIQPEINDCGKIVFVLNKQKVFFSLRAVFRYLI